MKFLRIILNAMLGLLREISDQNAYARHLKAHHVAAFRHRMAPILRRALQSQIPEREVLLKP